jgi:hypothetical protein
LAGGSQGRGALAIHVDVAINNIAYISTHFGWGFQGVGLPWEGPPKIPNLKPNLKVLNLFETLNSKPNLS